MTTHARAPFAPVDASPVAQTDALVASPAATARPPRKAALVRVALIYAILYVLPFPLSSLPAMSWLDDAYDKPWHVAIPWIGKHVLRLATDITIFSNGSGDTTYDYVSALVRGALAVLVTAAWIAIERRPPSSAKVHDALRVVLRYAIAAWMLSYGFAKVFKSQFPFPGPERLLEPYGESSPMGLLWTFMGYSLPYNVFTGGAEVVGGVLLFFRRTTTLGALIVSAVMVNVVMLNFCYDVPVKLFSSHLLLMAGILVIPDLRRLAGVLVFNRSTRAVSLAPPFRGPWLDRARAIVKPVFVGWILVSYAKEHVERAHERNDASTAPALQGTWEVDAMTRDGVDVPAVFAEKGRWHTITVGRRWLSIRMIDGPALRYQLKDEPEKKVVQLTDSLEGKAPATVTYTRPDADHLTIDVRLSGVPFTARLHRVAPEPLLVNRGFHWIQEYPFNR
jgi:uncharacterized membrane protein YphA (DoxX/SURF4 family)